MSLYLAVRKTYVQCSTEQEISMEENNRASKWMLVNDSRSNLRENKGIAKLRAFDT